MFTLLLVFSAIAALLLLLASLDRRPAFAFAGIVQMTGIVPTYENDPLEMELDRNEEKYLIKLSEDAETVLLREAGKLLEAIDQLDLKDTEYEARFAALLPEYAMLYRTEYEELINRYIQLLLEDNGHQVSWELISGWWLIG